MKFGWLYHARRVFVDGEFIGVQRHTAENEVLIRKYSWTNKGIRIGGDSHINARCFTVEEFESERKTFPETKFSSTRRITLLFHTDFKGGTWISIINQMLQTNDCVRESHAHSRKN